MRLRLRSKWILILRLKSIHRDIDVGMDIGIGMDTKIEIEFKIEIDVGNALRLSLR